MQETLRRLIRLQELEFALAEQEAVEDAKGALALLRELETSAAELPDSAVTLYRSLRARSLLAVVPVHNGACSGCGFKLPTAQVGAVAAATRLEQCRNCRRILYVRGDSLDRLPAGSVARTVPEGPARFSSPALMLPDLSSPAADGALAEIVATMVEAGVAHDAERLLSLALNRERVASTALGEGFAFPHVRGVEGGGMVFALALRRDGVSFEANRKVSIVAFTIIPAAATNLYLTLVRDLLHLFREETSRERLLSSTSSAAMFQVLRSARPAGRTAAAQ